MTEQKGHIYEFAGFRLIPDDGLLLKDGEPVSLTPKAFSTLVFLVERHGHLVPKTDLIEEVWENAYVEEAAVSRCVWTIRNALGEDAKSQQFIKTVPKRGYRFVAEVVERKGSTSGQGVPTLVQQQEKHQSATSSPQHLPNSNVLSINRTSFSRSSVAIDALPQIVEPAVVRHIEPLRVVRPAEPVRRFTRFHAAGLFVFLLAAGLGAFYFFGRNPIPSGTKQLKIAVLPLKPVVAGNRDYGIEFAVAESLILKISEAENLDVKRLNAVRRFVELDEDPIEAGRELGVDYVLSSNYQIDNGRIRVTSQLLNVRTGKTEQTFRYETDSTNVFSVQDAISNDIGNGVFAHFGGLATRFARKRGTENEKAYNLYHEALFLVDKGTREDSAKAVDLLEQTITLDPNFASAWAVKAQARCQFGHLGGGPPTTLFVTAELEIEKALALDPDNALALTVRGTINRDYHWNLADASKDLLHAIELDPNLTLAHRVLAGTYYRNGKFAEAVDEQKKAVDLNPTGIWDKWFLGEYLIAAGQIEEGTAVLQRVTENAPAFQPTYFSLWRSFNSRGDMEKAYEYFIRNKQAWADTPDEIDRFQKIYESSGWKGALRAELDLMIAQDPKGKYSTRKVYIAGLAAQLGENDVAFKYLDEAFQFRLIALSYLKVDPLLEPLRSHSRYSELLTRTGL